MPLFVVLRYTTGMPDELEQRGPDESAEAGARVREVDDAAREAAAEQAAAASKQAMQQARREEGSARRSDHGFARAFARFLQGQRDEGYLEALINLLDRNVPSSFLLAGVSLLDDESAKAFQEGIEAAPEHVRSLFVSIESSFVELPPTVRDLGRLRQWILMLVLAVDGLDAELRERLSAANRDADQWVRDFLQTTILQASTDSNAQARVDAAALAVRVQALLDKRPLPQLPPPPAA